MSADPLDERTEVAERFDPATMRGEMIEAEHMARYRWASRFAAGRRVLDAGCGTAYGTKLLADAGPIEVVGIDVAAAVLEEARAGMPAGVELVVGDLTDLPFGSGRFDLVVCFEVIEHLEEREEALEELRRVLVPSGLLAVSSPNRGVYPQGNPHHVHEYTPDELQAALAKRFSKVRLERQHTWITSGVLDSEAFVLGDDTVLGADIEARKLVADEIGQELYTVALAADCELPKGEGVLELATPVELRTWDALWHEQDEQLRKQAEILSAQAEHMSEQETLLQEQAEHMSEQETVVRKQAGHIGAQERLLREQETLLRVQAEHMGDLERLLAGHAQTLWDQTRLLRQKDRDLDRQRRELTQVRSQLAENETELTRLAETESLLDEVQRMNVELLKREEDLDELVAISQRYTVLVGSSSWRVTRPLRRLGEMVRKLRG